MFLLFLRRIPTEPIRLNYLHSNMFLLFLCPNSFANCASSKFTFQYVSIISCGETPNISAASAFTFQYVSIISVNANGEKLSEQIYIPICFYYFHLLRRIFGCVFRYLHSNMFLLFRSSTAKIQSILYSFTFQYVSIISFSSIINSLTSSVIYIPICFYYFAQNESQPCWFGLIYIPICFYYFVKNGQAWLNCN